MYIAKHAALFTAGICLFSALAFAGPGAPAEGTWITARGSAEGWLSKHSHYRWTLDKTNSPQSLELHRHKSAQIDYQLVATRTLDDETAKSWVKGETCVNNVGSVATHGLKLTSQVQVRNGSEWIEVPGTTAEAEVRAQLGARETACFPYRSEARLRFDQEYRLRTLVTIRNFADNIGEDHGVEVSAPFLLANAIGTESGAEAVLTDVLTCPEGYSCTDPGIGQKTLTNSATINYSIVITNHSCERGKISLLKNIATLSVKDVGHSEHKASAVVVVNSGARRGD